MNRRSFLGLSLGGIVAAIIAPVMPAVAKLITHEPLWSGEPTYDEPTYDMISATTLKEIREDCVYVNFFKPIPFQKWLRSEEPTEFSSGAPLLEPFKYGDDDFNGDA